MESGPNSIRSVEWFGRNIIIFLDICHILVSEQPGSYDKRYVLKTSPLESGTSCLRQFRLWYQTKASLVSERQTIFILSPWILSIGFSWILFCHKFKEFLSIVSKQTYTQPNSSNDTFIFTSLLVVSRDKSRPSYQVDPAPYNPVC